MAKERMPPKQLGGREEFDLRTFRKLLGRGVPLVTKLCYGRFSRQEEFGRRGKGGGVLQES